MSNTTGSKSKGLAVIGPDLVIVGELRNGHRVEVHGLIEGTVTAKEVVVRSSGRILGTLVADNAEIEGEVRGHVLVRQVLQIGNTGRVFGDVRYGQIAMQGGAELSADMRNMPPELAGDFTLTTKRGGSVIITTDDLTAIDPDSPTNDLVFAVTRQAGGHVARAAAKATPIDRFTQPDLVRNTVLFVHDGSANASASFDVVVTDQLGATSGPAKTVQVDILR
jgi:cytoskeletal protein CcmA (bactofilin family)